jgi:hypothetical protein
MQVLQKYLERNTYVDSNIYFLKIIVCNFNCKIIIHYFFIRNCYRYSDAVLLLRVASLSFLQFRGTERICSCLFNKKTTLQRIKPPSSESYFPVCDRLKINNYLPPCCSFRPIVINTKVVLYVF